MRTYSTALKILFIVALLLSVSCSIILGISASSTLANTVSSRREVYYKAALKLDSSKSITLTATMPTDPTDINGQFTLDTYSCSKNDKASYDCTLISKLYDKDAKLIKTSYFPGDGYKYTKVEGEEKGTKQPYENTQIASSFSNFYLGPMTYLAILSYDRKTIDDYKIKYSSDITFDFNSFSLLKGINVEYMSSGVLQQFEFDFNKNNHLTDLFYKNMNSKCSIKYSKTNLKFPNLTNYLVA